MATVKQEFAASGDEKVANAYRKLAEQVVNLETKLERLTKASQEGAKKGAEQHSYFEQVLQKQIGTIGGVAASWLTVNKMIDGVNAGLERTIALQRSAAGAHGNLARGQAELFLNTFGQDEATKKYYMESAQSISSVTGVGESETLQSLARQAGRGVGLKSDDIVGAQLMASRLGRHTPEQIEPLSTVIQQTMRATGKGVEWSAALAQSGAAAAFPGDPRLQSRFLQQALSGSLANISNPDGAAAEQIFEVAAALSQAGGEERGEAGRTATISMLAQFDEFRDGRGKWLSQSPWGGKPRANPVKGAPSAPGDMIDWLRANPSQMKRFFDKASFEQHYEGIIRRMVMEPGSQVGQLYSDTKKAVGPDIGSLNRQLADLERGTPQVRAATGAAKNVAGLEQYAARNTERALRSEAYDIGYGKDGQPSVLDQTSQYDWRPAWMTSAANWFGQRFSDGRWEDQTRSELQQRAAQIRGTVKLDTAGRPSLDALPGGAMSTRFTATPDSMLTAEQRRALDLVNTQLKRLEEIRDEIKLLREGDEQRRPSAGPALNGQRGSTNER